MTIRKLSAALPSSPASILFGSNEFEQASSRSPTPACATDSSGCRPKPRAKDTPFERIEIGFKDRPPQAMRLADNFGQMTNLSSRRSSAIRSSSPSLPFTPPKGADVLTE